ncbi:MAG TPA: S4 domain-containing protein, partial [Candidatus Propionivibrio aalborgensis]|nr:S4 domain-containing protein [Candidatus Propionivibrio aalborgensis]
MRTAKLRMMKSPDRETEVDSHKEKNGKDAERADYSANPRLALSVPADCGGQRLDQVLARLRPQHSRSRMQIWIRQGRVTVGGVTVSEPRQKLWGG